MRHAILFLAAILPAQQSSPNLIRPDAWQPVNPAYMTRYAVTTTDVQFNPYFPGPWPDPFKQAGVEQTINVPAPGLYAFEFTSSGAIRSTGQFGIGVQVGAVHLSTVPAAAFNAETWICTTPIRIDKAGPATIRIMVETSNLTFDLFAMRHPKLEAIVEPATKVAVSNVGLGSIRADFTAHADLLFVSPLLSHTPVAVPGIAGIIGLHLPTTYLAAMRDPQTGVAYYDGYTPLTTWPYAMVGVDLYWQAFEFGTASTPARVGSVARMEWR